MIFKIVIVLVSTLFVGVCVAASENRGNLIRQQRDDSCKCDDTYDPVCVRVPITYIFVELEVTFLLWDKCYSNCNKWKELNKDDCDLFYCEPPFAFLNTTSKRREVACDCQRHDCGMDPKDEFCGSDGSFYYNECFAKRKACNSQKTVSEASPSSCANSKKCSDCGLANCIHDSEGAMSCRCDDCLSQSKNEMCDENSVLFDNECLIKKKACEAGKTEYTAKQCETTTTTTTTTTTQSTSTLEPTTSSTDIITETSELKNVSKNTTDKISAMDFKLTSTSSESPFFANPPVWFYFVIIINLVGITYIMVALSVASIRYLRSGRRKKPVILPLPERRVVVRRGKLPEVYPIRMSDYNGRPRDAFPRPRRGIERKNNIRSVPA